MGCWNPSSETGRSQQAPDVCRLVFVFITKDPKRCWWRQHKKDIDRTKMLVGNKRCGTPIFLLIEFKGFFFGGLNMMKKLHRLGKWNSMCRVFE